MFKRKSLPRAVIVVVGLLGTAWTSVAALQIAEKTAKPMQVALKRTGAQAAGPLSSVNVALEIEAHQPNVPAGIRGTIVVTNGAATVVELMDPGGTSQLEVQTTAGRALKPAPAPAPGQGHVHGAKPSEALRLGPKESRRIEVALSEVALDETAAPSPTAAVAPPGTPRPTSMPLLGGNYRVRAKVRLVPASGDAKPADFESGWVDVVLGTK